MTVWTRVAEPSNLRRAGQSLLVASVVFSGACGGGTEAPPATPPAETAAAAPTASASPRVMFLEPQDGATVKSPVHLRFGLENYQIGVVPPGEITTVRPGMGHHHVGIDTDCLPPGTVIEKANPWVHFGDGKAEIDMQLPPGKHKLTLQLGDDKHTTITGLCQSITVNVAE
jgi:hypothetical protein